MRIALALVIICDLIIRAGDLQTFFTDSGIWPTHLIKNFGWQPGYWSFHALSGKETYVWALFTLHFLFAFCLLIGYRTTLSTILVWVFTVSLHNRNLFILQSGDDLLRLTLFWGIFLPWGNAFSVDSKKQSTKSQISNPATMAYLLLITSVYLFTVFFKNSSEWHNDGTAIYYALSLEQIRLPVGDWLYRHPNLMKTLTHFVYVIEIIIPVAILFPDKKGISRGIAFLLLIVLHIGIGLTMYVGLFFLISMATAIGLVPCVFLNKLKLKAINNFNKTVKKANNKLKSVKTAFVSIIITLCLFLNLSYMQWFPYELNDEIKLVINTLRLNQYWGMFSPHILKEESWYVHEGFTEQGKHWDLYYNQPVIVIDKPEHLVKHYKTDRWRKLAENIQRNEYTFLRPLYCKYYLKKWNKEHPENLMKNMNFIIMKETSLANYQSSVPEKIQLCFCTIND